MSVPFSFRISNGLVVKYARNLLSLFSVIAGSSQSSVRIGSNPSFSHSYVQPSFDNLAKARKSLANCSFSVPLITDVPVPP